MVQLVVESWIWYGIVVWIALSRFISRRLALGAFINFQADDYFMIFAICFYTTLIVTINIVANTNSNLLPPGVEVSSLSQDDIDERVYGSKLVLVVEECQCCVVWLAKACLVTFYLRLTALSKERLVLIGLACYIGATFIIMECLYLGYWCTPLYEYWAVPTNNVQCNTAENHLILNLCFNLTSDIAMLITGLPIFFRVKLPLRQKIPVILLFSLGLFVVVAAILNKVYSFGNPYGSEWTYWYVRESSTSLIVANLPFVWNLYKRIPFISPGVKETSKQDNDVLSSIERPFRKSKHFRSMRRSYAGGTAADKPNVTADIDLECSENPIGGITAEQMLQNEYLGVDNANERIDETADVNMYTHPALYCAIERQKRVRQALQLSVDPLTGASSNRDHIHLAEDDVNRQTNRGSIAGISPTYTRSATSSNRRSMGSFV